MLDARTLLTIKELHFILLSDTKQATLTEFQNLSVDDVLRSNILDLGQGLFEVTSTVQFIHSSVPEFLRSDQDIFQVLQAHGPVSIGMIHEHTKQSCLETIKSLAATPPTAEGDLVSDCVRYAVENVFHHANEAAKDGIPQTEFLESFPLGHWIQLVNIISSVYRYATSTNILQVLEDQGMQQLIEELLNHSTHLGRICELDEPDALSRFSELPYWIIENTPASEQLNPSYQQDESNHQQGTQYQPHQHLTTQPRNQYSQEQLRHVENPKNDIRDNKDQGMLTYRHQTNEEHGQYQCYPKQLTTLPYTEPIQARHVQPQPTKYDHRPSWLVSNYENNPHYGNQHQYGHKLYDEEPQYIQEQTCLEGLYPNSSHEDYHSQGSRDNNHRYYHEEVEDQEVGHGYIQSQEDENQSESDSDSNIGSLQDYSRSDNENYTVE